MQKQITVALAEHEFSIANQAARQSGFKIDEYLIIMLKAIGAPRQPNEMLVERIFHILPDNIVLKLATRKMAVTRSKQHSRLLEKLRSGKINEAERQKLETLSEEYERGTLQKAFARAEAVRRGLLPPFHS